MSQKPEPSADYSLRILWSLARWVEDTKGPEELAAIAARASLAASDFDGSTHWVSLEQVERVLAEVRELAGSEEAFREALAHRFNEGYGAFRYMIWAVSQQQMNEAAAKMGKVITNVGQFEVLSSERTRFAFRYRSTRAESRLMCISRQVAWSIAPSIWGNPSATVDERACIAKGDAYCEYHLRWFDRSRSLPIFAGGAAGVVAAVVVGLVGPAGWLALGLLPLLGASLAYVRELRLTGHQNVNFARELNEVTRALGEAEADTRSEIVALHQRQRDWIRLMEQQVTDRTTTLERIVDGLDGLQKSRVTTIRGFSHDLRNPLFVVRGNTQFLMEKYREGDEGEALRDMETATTQIEAMLSSLMEVATAETGFVKLQPRSVAIPPLAETFRRRLKALVHGRDIKVSVFCTREAPEQIFIDPLVFDRVVDNVLTNAAKYTDRGSILLEISGTPGVSPLNGATDDGVAPSFLTLKLSDTGQGIEPTQVERIFRPRPANEVAKRPDSLGIGLSSVVRLLAQIGGRLDVMSKPGIGTTFWAHFPVAPPATKRGSLAPDDNLESIITRIVTIRKVDSA